MNILDETISWFAPDTALRRLRARAAIKILQQHTRGYEGAKRGRRTDGWIARGTSSNAEIGVALTTLRDRAREAVRNNPYAAKAVNVIKSNAVGTGIIPDPKTKNKGFNSKAKDLFERHAESIDADGNLNFYALQSLVARAIPESGECLVRYIYRDSRFGLRVPFQIQVLEGDYVDQNKNGRNGDNIIVHGVEFDRSGRRAAWWLFDAHPGDSFTIRGGGGLTSKRVPADQADLIYRMDRPGQVRAVSWLAPVLMQIHDLGDYQDAELMRKKIGACLMAFVTRDSDVDGSAAPSSKDAQGRDIETFSPGMFEYLRPGESVSFSDPPTSGDYVEFTRENLRAIAAGIGITYEQLTGDLSQVNYSSYRAGHLEFRSFIEAYRWEVLIPKFCNPVWRRFIDAAYLAGELPKQMYEVKWTPPAFQSVDPKKDTESAIAQVRAGLMPLREAIAQNGYDPDATLAEIAETNSLLDTLGIVLDSDPRKPKTGAAPAPASTEDQPTKD